MEVVQLTSDLETMQEQNMEDAKRIKELEQQVRMYYNEYILSKGCKDNKGIGTIRIYYNEYVLCNM